MEKKIFLDKNDGLEVAVDSLIHAKSDTVILNIPKNSVLGKSQNNFHVLKRESGTAGKTLMIESVDDHILELASLAMITAINPVFHKKERAVSDILPRAKKSGSRSPEKVEEEKEEEKEKKQDFFSMPKKKYPVLEEEPPKDELEEEEERTHTKTRVRRIHGGTAKKTKIGLFLLCSIGIIAWIGFFVLPHAVISVELKKQSFSFDEIVEVDKNRTEPSIGDSRIYIHGELFSEVGNYASKISAEKKQGTAEKAKGTLQVVNAFGTTAQRLVATTRFESPDGKIFRLDKDVSIPGGKMVKGVLQPGSLLVPVTADNSGSDYNIGPVEHWNIPGFKGKPQYEKIYGVSTSSMAGGGSGEQYVVASSTASSTEEGIIQTLKSSLEEKFKVVQKDTFTLLPEGSSFLITKKEIQPTENGDTNLYVEGTLKQIVFEEDALKQAIIQKFSTQKTEGMKVDTFTLSYASSTPNFASGTLTFEATGTVSFVADVPLDAFKESILGKDAEGVKQAVLSVQGINGARVQFSPFWVSKVPKSSSKVEIKSE